jgi:hypothetical protein
VKAERSGTDSGTESSPGEDVFVEWQKDCESKDTRPVDSMSTLGAKSSDEPYEYGHLFAQGEAFSVFSCLCWQSIFFVFIVSGSSSLFSSSSSSSLSLSFSLSFFWAFLLLLVKFLFFFSSSSLVNSVRVLVCFDDAGVPSLSLFSLFTICLSLPPRSLYTHVVHEVTGIAPSLFADCVGVYCIMAYEKQEVKTTTIRTVTNLKWNEGFSLYVLVCWCFLLLLFLCFLCCFVCGIRWHVRLLVHSCTCLYVYSTTWDFVRMCVCGALVGFPLV